MDRQTLLKLLQITKRHYVRVMAFVVFLVVVISGIAYGMFPQEVVQAPTIVADSKEVQKSLFARFAPVRIVIPKINLDTTFVSPLGLNPDKTIEVPDTYTEVGWYQGGATPGEIGPSVVLGHVDSYKGPAVFYNLGRLAQGDEISITREDGTTAVFVVDYIERFSQDSFPTELVYGKTDVPTLRLVTCSGVFNKNEQKYSHNLVVFATLK